MSNDIDKWGLIIVNHWNNNKIKRGRSDLLETLRKWVAISTKKGDLNIPKWKFRAPNLRFAESDESYREIVTQNVERIKELDRIEDIDEFIKQSFEFIKFEIGLNPNIQLRITENDNHYDVVENTVYISRNWAGHTLKHVKWKWDKAEIFWWLVHEFNHYLQRKEFILNLDWDSPYRVWVINFLQQSPQAHENIRYILSHYADNLEFQELFEKAKVYGKNREYYISEKIDKDQVVTNYVEYRKQPVEAESFRRGDMVVEEYRKVVGMV